jgi:hypothetical protein
VDVDRGLIEIRRHHQRRRQLDSSYGWAYGGNPVYTAKLSDTTKWTNMIHTGRGANQMAYDSAHRIDYEADWANGLWRLVTC